MTMKPTIAYVDGFNLFYGLLKGTRDLWLDPVEFVRRLFREELEEKRSDVNIATSMVLDAVNNRAESFVLVSGDTDFIGPVNIVRKDYGKNVIVLNPHTRRSDLKQYASYYKDIPRDLPSQCQLPDEIPIGTHGNVIRRPLSWQ